MEKFYIDGTQEFIPKIELNPVSNHHEISGESHHEYTWEFFEPIFKWLEEYLTTPGRTIVMDFRMSYFNTASAKAFYEIIESLVDYKKHRYGDITINWYYEEGDLDMLEIGEDYAEDSGADINLIPYPKVHKEENDFEI
ncbi:DUF1987 domain-containing protein [Flammeovirgaceae bacterium SG7u.111]|nr:DUF1987 domain-containing protein [Flammeovirgaceae bacterium SG7u.132]WPO34907.1 DUF1987 domain-containing protein [Flammeovirgaceae bacterium SG7u.111]